MFDFKGVVSVLFGLLCGGVALGLAIGLIASGGSWLWLLAVPVGLIGGTVLASFFE
jgi:hypothetical protein